MVFADASGLPLAVDAASASDAEVNLVEPLLDSAVIAHLPGTLVYDKAADCDALRDRLLVERGVDLVSRTARTASAPASRTDASSGVTNDVGRSSGP